MARSIPVQAQYAFIGTLTCAGIRSVGGNTFIAGDISGAALSVQDPASVIWVTQRSVNHAMRKTAQQDPTYVVNLDNPVITQALLVNLNADPKAKKYTTEEMIVKFSGGDSPENRAFAAQVLAALNDFYLPVTAAQVA